MTTPKILLCIQFLFVPLNSNANSNSCKNIFLTSPFSTAISQLQQSSTAAYARTSDYSKYIKPSGGGACAGACVVNLVQTVGALTKVKELLSSEILMLASFIKMPELRDGRVTNEQLVDIVSYLLEKYTPEVSPKVELTTSKKSKETDLPIWENVDVFLDQIKIRNQEVKIIVYDVFSSEGGRLGRHFVLLKESSNNSIEVIDPNSPNKVFTHKISLQEDPNDPSFQSVALERHGSTIFDQRLNYISNILTISW